MNSLNSGRRLKKSQVDDSRAGDGEIEEGGMIRQQRENLARIRCGFYAERSAEGSVEGGNGVEDHAANRADRNTGSYVVAVDTHSVQRCRPEARFIDGENADTTGRIASVDRTRANKVRSIRRRGVEGEALGTAEAYGKFEDVFFNRAGKGNGVGQSREGHAKR